jgi:hypothetical protein
MSLIRTNWKLIVGVLVGCLVIATALRLTRRVPPFDLPTDWQPGMGFVDSETAQTLQF